MEKKKWVKTGLAIVAAVVPFGLSAIIGYYGYKEFKRRQEVKKLEQKNE
jgi:cell division protein FtsB